MVSIHLHIRIVHVNRSLVCKILDCATQIIIVAMTTATCTIMRVGDPYKTSVYFIIKSMNICVGPILVKCSGECRGAKAAKARVKRKVEYLRRRGKSPHILDDWTNMSFTCSCNDE